MAQVGITFNKRSYRFECGDADLPRLEKVAHYVKEKLEALTREHGNAGDERLMLMAALTIADELFDARADIDELLDDGADKLKAVAEDAKTAKPTVRAEAFIRRGGG